MADNKINLLVTLKDKASSKLEGLRGQFGQFGDMLSAKTLVIAAAAAAIAKLAFSSAEAGDTFAKTAAQVGVMADSLSRLTFAAQIGGTDMTSVSTALRVVSKRVNDANNGLLTSVRAFTQAGIAVKKANGQFKNAEELLMDGADAFKAIEDPVKRTALAQELFGRAGTKLIPILMMGKKGIQELMEESDRLRISFTNFEAKQAEEFADAWLRLKSVFVGLGRVVGKTFTPILTDLFGFLQAMFMPLLPILEVLITAIARPFKVLARVLTALKPLFEAIADVFEFIADIGKSAERAFEDSFNKIIEFLNRFGLQIEKIKQETREKAAEDMEETASFMKLHMEGFMQGIKQAKEDYFATTVDIAIDAGNQMFQVFDKVQEDIGTAIGAALTESENLKDGMKQVFETMKQEVIKTLAIMTVKMLAFLAIAMLADYFSGGLLSKSGGDSPAKKLGGSGILDKLMPKGGGGFKGMIPGLAEGGIVTAPTLAMVGEAGPEAIIPLNGDHGLGVQSINQVNVLPNANIDAALMEKPMSFWVDLAQEKILPALNELGKGGETTTLNVREAR
ncbi:MAG: hypothetical protein Unbinned834contig1000_25 [Prokaryotic dsDNA virus sp.]|nr:MAG: hypothetical protein Unbinned834contig1000_25 [Prokaryotic dsDNA virus sp.]